MSRGNIELDRAATIAALNDEAGRKASTATIMYQLAIADRIGLSMTDLVCGEILSRTGAITAGELTELIALSTGAVTGIVDRLEKAGFVRRVNDPNDRRRVILEPIGERFDKVSGNPYDALEKRFNELYAEYSDEELRLLLDFMRQSITIFDEEGARLREQRTVAAAVPENKPHMEVNIRARMDMQAKLQADMHANAEARIQIRRGGPKETRSFFSPRADVTAAKLEWSSGAMRMNLHPGRNLSELYRAEFKHDIPIVRDHEAIVSVQYRHRTLLGRGGGDADVQLNPLVTWTMELDCGATHLDADLRTLKLAAFTLKSKASRVVLLLPPPVGTVKLRFESGLSNIRIERPKGVPVHLEFEGDFSELRFDRHKVNVSNEIRESPDYKRATDRYAIEFVGGGSKLAVEERR